MIKTLFQILVVNFGLFFQSTTVVLTQLFSLCIYPFSYDYYRMFIGYTMRMWSQNLVAIVQWFAPADIVFTVDPSCGSIVKKDEQGHTRLVLPQRAIFTANHQVSNRCYGISSLTHPF
ncbi:uncharacterized protein B0P05DRAFT_559678 [Gilbertella persicaria]|uniref:uncharacterized protein n=1 Tax=Gilbertella persicaria TaxID=101096 RepID=UPI002220BB9B|nr:uncharacterized protein B0P05DRAFT_559678 [Gilbertella persicaria]KAI8057545.1 hypothetical protein B0P05DRAFT_559678 [Gilbertella persicaria]